MVLMGGLLTQCSAQTFIRAILPNPSPQEATGYKFQILTPGAVQTASLRNNVLVARTGEARIQTVAYSKPSQPKLDQAYQIAAHETPSSVKFGFDDKLPADGKIDLRISFSPTDYWKVYFNDTFQYADGHSERSRIPYAAFFVNFTPTKDPAKVLATLTVINNIASTYGIASNVVNDEKRPTINFKHATVFINNDLHNYNLEHFDQATGQKVDLPASFSLKKGESQVFDLGVVNKDSYVYTMSEVSYEGQTETFPIACAHSADATDTKGETMSDGQNMPAGSLSSVQLNSSASAKTTTSETQKQQTSDVQNKPGATSEVHPKRTNPEKSKEQK